MREECVEMAALQTTIIAGEAAARADVVLLHGYSMEPTSLSPFAHAMQLPVRFLLPQAPCVAPPGGRSWWPVDADRRRATLERGPRDLADSFPDGRREARACLRNFLAAARAQAPLRPVILCGFSQGGMLACDTVLIDGQQVSALALLSSSRIALAQWQPQRARLRDVPVLISHGTQDDDLAFAAGEALRDFVTDAGARVTWVPFDAGHCIPLNVWRQLKRFIEAFL